MWVRPAGLSLSFKHWSSIPHQIRPFAEAGANKALIKSFDIVSDGVLNLKFVHVVQNPMISGIQITRIAGTGGGGIGTTGTQLSASDLFGDDEIDSLFGDSGAVV
ncbi:MAG: hypothetical protein U0996_18775 [Planctomycetaceae bacterium]